MWGDPTPVPEQHVSQLSTSKKAQFDTVTRTGMRIKD